MTTSQTPPQRDETGDQDAGNPPPRQEMDYCLLTYPEAAQVLGVTLSTIRALIDDGELPMIRIRSSVRIDKADLVAYINKSRSGDGQTTRTT